MWASRASIAVSVTLATIGSVLPSARAEGPSRNPDSVARAEARFHEGERLFDGKRVAEACAAFDESEHLDPQLGTLLNLAFCEETLGKAAAAWRAYTRGAVWGEQRGQHDRAAWALARALEVSKTVPLVLLALPPRASSYSIEIDGDAVPTSDFASPLPLDSGTHHLRVSAPGRQAQQLEVSVLDGPSTQSVNIPALAPLPDAPRTLAEPARPEASSHGNGRTIVGLVQLGIGVASLGVGTYYGVMTLSKKSDASSHCAGTECDATGVALQDDAHRFATVSTVAFGVGVVALAVGAWLTLTAPTDGAPPPRARIQPLVGPRVAGLGMVGAW